MSNINNHNRVDLFVYPCTEKNNDYDYNQLTIGDLHSNAIKLIYFLIKNNIFEISDRDFNTLVKIYKHNNPNLNTFREILSSNFQLIDASKLVRLIGDELADRGANDYFVLKIIQKMHSSQLNFNILFSNHAADFIMAIELLSKRHNILETTITDDKYAQSLKTLDLDIFFRKVELEEVLHINDHCYAPHIKLIDYGIFNNNINIYSHAPIGLDEIKIAAKFFNISYKDETIHELALTIELINTGFSKLLKTKKLHEIFTLDSHKRVHNLNPQDIDIITFIAWNRSYENLNRPCTHKNYNLIFIHGHDLRDENKSNVVNLDNYLGKSMDFNQGDLNTFHSESFTLKEVLESQLMPLNNLILNLSDSKKKKEAEKLNSSIINLIHEFFKNPTELSYHQFKKKYLATIEDARPSFKNHPIIDLLNTIYINMQKILAYFHLAKQVNTSPKFFINKVDVVVDRLENDFLKSCFS